MSTHSRRVYIIIAIPFVLMAIGVFFLPNERIWDERLFIPVIQSIGENYVPSLEQIKNLKSPLGPVFFIIYGFVGKVLGFSLIGLRLFNIALSFIVCLLVYRLLRDNVKYPLALTLLFVANPYFLIMTAPLIYTDILATLFVLTALYFLKKDRRILVGVMFGLAICTRQLMIIFPFALGLVDLWYCYKKEKPALLVLFDLIPIVMFMPLIMLWQGINSPFISKNTEHVNNASTFGFSISSLNYALIMILIFSLPIIWRKLSFRKIIDHAIFVAPTLLLLVLGMPMRLNKNLPASSGMPDTAGALDLIFVFIEPVSTYVIIPLLLFFALINLKEIVTLPKRDFHSLYAITLLICFVLLFALNSVAWDKYFIPLIPIIFLASANTLRENSSSKEFT